MEVSTYPAHIRREDAGWAIQSVADHCRQAAKWAEKSVQGSGLTQTAFLAALMHDMGKCRDDFKNYIITKTIDGKAWRGERVIHTFQGVRYLMDRYHEKLTDESYEEMIKNLTAELVAYAVGAHHGLFDCVDEKRQSGFLHRIEAENLQYEQSVQEFLNQCADEKELDSLFQHAYAEVAAIIPRLDSLISEKDDGSEGCFYLGLTARMLLSAVIEGDRRDTAAFMNGCSYPAAWGNENVHWEDYLSRVEQRLGELPSDTTIQQARGQISFQCRRFAERPSGIYRLNVPTGAGKTLSALRYGLAHAAKWKKSRIIFTSPLLSILEQNAQVIRDYLKADDLILEHHSNVLRTEEDGGELDLRELRVESWSAPIIITTLVQLLNTFFSGKTTCIRRFQALCNSIIVIDEVQTVPSHMLSLFNLAVNYLAEICQATIVLCSATQPYLTGVTHPIYKHCQDIVPYQKELWKAFQRTTICDMGLKRLDEIPDDAIEVLKTSDSLLIVCNKKAEAEALFCTLSVQQIRCFHLSASMCMEHRRQVLAELEASLSLSRAGQGKTVCVSTQVIEAGVDISFECVIRLAAGMDSVVQSAGRCNRNGESAEPVPVYLVRCANENLSHLRDIQMGRDASLQLLELFRQDPGRYNFALDSHKAIEQYYRSLYGEMPEGYQDYSVQKGGRVLTLFNLLSANTDYCDEDCPTATEFQLNQAFKLAGSLFTVFDEDTTDVIVPYKKGKELILELGTLDPEYDGAKLSAVLEQAKGYTVSIYGYQKKRMEKSGALIPKCGGSVLVLQDGFYDNQTGLRTSSAANDYLEV